ncbi:MAG: hypothetical protein PHR16_04710 [Methylovulum sp.]|nr:hypothetical protein [Methylovulum sp.]
MTPEQFNHYAQQGNNHITVTREILADLDTPLSAYLKLADGAYSYLLESVHGGKQWSRYPISGRLYFMVWIPQHRKRHQNCRY